MRLFRRTPREKRISIIDLLGIHYEKYRTITIILSSFLMFAEVALAVYWQFDQYDISEVVDNLYLASHIFLACVAAIYIACLFFNKYKKINRKFLVIITHVYIFFLIAIATILSVLDLMIGLFPVSYCLVCLFVAGIYLVEPKFFSIIAALGFLSIFIMHLVNFRITSEEYGTDYFDNLNLLENIMYFAAFFGSVVLVNVRGFRVTREEQQVKDKLELLTYNDELTGLLNERSYLKEVDHINEQIEKGKQEPFAIMVMDVNNLKATNDRLGHRFGCSLIVHCGEVFPTIFSTSKMFHFGGDEFIIIVKGQDFDNFPAILKDFEDKCAYSTHEFDGEKLIFSVAMGYATYEQGMAYRDVFQLADDAMYKNKVMLKEKYGMKGR